MHDAASPILVTGATGRLGRLVVHRLQQRNVAVRVLARRPDAARELFGSAVEIVAGSFSDGSAMQAAMHGAAAALLLSPVGPTLEDDQRAVIDAGRAAGLPFLVKVSGSHWTIDPPGRSWSGDCHRRIELALQDSGIAHAVLRPSAWMQVAFAAWVQALNAGGDEIVAPYADAALGFIDARDIADVAATLLLSRRAPASPLVLTGPQALGGAQLAAAAGRRLGRPVRYQALGVDAQAQRLAASPLPPIVRQVQAEFGALMRSGAAAGVTDTVSQVLGRPARSVDDFLAGQLPG